VLVFFVVFSFCKPMTGQETKEPLSGKLLQAAFSEFECTSSPERKILSLKNKKIIYKINPLTYISSGMLFVYQHIFSEQIQAKCAYEISCSEFTKLSIQRYGFFKGFFIGINQLSSCFHGVANEHCMYTHSSDFKIINSVEE
ncbi:MAG TPA: membrane protein insertion efficiency factor YidD, partial [Nitrosopumilaceae archaeon]|nr:membrane protein insertion efficiency factor YidD [Nitrosopumilaceae archaeon]